MATNNNRLQQQRQQHGHWGDENLDKFQNLATEAQADPPPTRSYHYGTILRTRACGGDADVQTPLALTYPGLSHCQSHCLADWLTERT